MGGELRPISLLPASNLHSSPAQVLSTSEAMHELPCTQLCPGTSTGHTALASTFQNSRSISIMAI